MNQRLSPRMSPQAKKAQLQQPEQTVSGLLELTPSADPQIVSQAITAHGGQVRGLQAESRTVTFEIGAQHLSALADLDEVAYLSTSEPYSA